MTDNATIWKSLQEHLPRRTWIPIARVFATVEQHVALDDEDLKRSRSKSPRWKSNVRRLLGTKERAGRLRARTSR